MHRKKNTDSIYSKCIAIFWGDIMHAYYSWGSNYGVFIFVAGT